MEQLTRDVRFGFRMIRANPGFTTAAILMLALGIGATTAIFSFVDAVLLNPLPFPDADRIVNVWEKPPGAERNGISTLNFLDWKNQNTVFTAMAALTWDSLTLTDADVPVQLRDTRVSTPYIERNYPESNKGWSATVDRYQDRLVDDRLRRSLLVLLAAVGGFYGGRLCHWSLGALGLTRLLSSLLFGISPRDPWTLLLVGAVLAVVAAAACYIPAHRAAGVDPVVALRHE